MQRREKLGKAAARGRETDPCQVFVLVVGCLGVWQILRNWDGVDIGSMSCSDIEQERERRHATSGQALIVSERWGGT